MQSKITIKIPLYLILISCLLFSCAANNGKYNLVRNTSPRVSTLGFTITPPPGKNWYERLHEDSLLYLKITAETNYLLSTRATEIVFDRKLKYRQDFIEYAKTQNSHFEKNARYKNCSFNYLFDKISTSKCIRYEHSYDDYGSDKKGKHPYIKVYNKGLICQHPSSPDLGIDISYKEESFPKTLQSSFRNEGELFLNSLNFL